MCAGVLCSARCRLRVVCSCVVAHSSSGAAHSSIESALRPRIEPPRGSWEGAHARRDWSARACGGDQQQISGLGGHGRVRAYRVAQTTTRTPALHACTTTCARAARTASLAVPAATETSNRHRQTIGQLLFLRCICPAAQPSAASIFSSGGGAHACDTNTNTHTHTHTRSHGDTPAMTAGARSRCWQAAGTSPPAPSWRAPGRFRRRTAGAPVRRTAERSIQKAQERLGDT